MFPGAVLGRAPTGSARVVAEGGACLEQLVPREAGPAKMIQAILVFNNHGKPRLVRFYQRFVSAARPVTHPRPFPSPRCAAALASTSGFGTVHDPPPLLCSSSLGPGSSVLSDTFPWVLRQTRYTVCLIGILDDKNPCLYAFFKNLIDEHSFVIVGSMGSCKFSQGGEQFFFGIICFIADWDLSGLVYPLPSKITGSLFQNWG